MDDQVDEKNGAADPPADVGGESAAAAAEAEPDAKGEFVPDGTTLGPGPRKDPTVKPGPPRTVDGEEIAGVPAGVEDAGAGPPHKHSEAYLEVDVKDPDALVRIVRDALSGGPE